MGNTGYWLVQENVRIIIILLRKWCHKNKHFLRACPTSWRKTAA